MSAHSKFHPWLNGSPEFFSFRAAADAVFIHWGGSTSPKAMSVSSPKARIFGGEAAGISQRVEVNAFHLR
jgi:hypothetical protein